MKTFILLPTLLLAFLELKSQEIENTKTFNHEGIPVLLSSPDNYSESKTYPTIIFLHGADRSNTKHHPAKYAKRASIDFPFIVIAPSCKSGCSYSSIDLTGILEKARKMISVDEKRVYLTGYSMGGAGTWINLKKMGDILAAASPLAPAGGNTTDLCKVKNLPIRVYHGTSDGGYNNSQQMINYLKECGSTKAELISLEGKGHGIWPGIFSDERFYEWLLTNSK